MFKNLLRRKTFDGYPGDFVLARIRGRGYCAPDTSAGRVATRRELDREYAWIFGLLDDKATKAFVPYFALHETERLLACLRMQRGRESSRIAPLLADSLLSSEAMSLLDSKRDPGEMVHGLASLLEFPSDLRKTVNRLLIDESWTEIEACFHESCLRWAGRICRRRGMKEFFQIRIDMRNLSTARKALRWDSDKAPPLIEGGMISPGSLRRFYEAGNRERLEDFARSRLAEGSSGDFERDLIHGLAVRLHRRSRCAGGLTMVLAHLWGLYAGLWDYGGTKPGYGEVA